MYIAASSTLQEYEDRTKVSQAATFPALYGVILDFLVLSSLKITDYLPLAIRDRVEESLRIQTQAISYWSAILSLGWYLVIVDIIVLCLLFFIVIVLPKIFLDSAFRAQAIQATKEKKEANTQEKDSKSKSNSLLMGSNLLTLATLANHAMFSRSLEDAAISVSFDLDGALARFRSISYDVTRTPVIPTTAFVYALIFAVWSIYRSWRLQQREKTDEETRFSSVEKAQEVETDSDSDGLQKRPQVGFFEKVDPWNMLL